jgi:hypothetical protein
MSHGLDVLEVASKGWSKKTAAIRSLLLKASLACRKSTFP